MRLVTCRWRSGQGAIRIVLVPRHRRHSAADRKHVLGARHGAYIPVYRLDLHLVANATSLQFVGLSKWDTAAP